MLIKQLRLDLTFFKPLANFPTEKCELDCGLELKANIFQLRLILVLEGYDYSSHVISRNLPEACDGCWSATLELIKGTNGGVDKVVRVVQA